MSESMGGIHYDLDLKDKEFQGKVKKADSMIGSLAQRFKDAEAGSKVLLGAITATAAGLVAFGVSSVNAYKEAHTAEVKLVQLHHKNTGATMKQTQELIAQANALQGLGVVEADAIINGQAQLSTFKLSTGAIKSLTPAMADMVAHIKGANATGDDFVNIGNLIGKVMEGNVGALGRYGVSFDKNQEKVLKNGNQSQRAAMLAKILAQNYGGVNKALAQTPEGKIANLKNRFGDLQEQLGGVILKGLDPMVDSLSVMFENLEDNRGLMFLLNEFFVKNKEMIFAVAGAILIGLVPALYSLAAGVWAVLAPLLPFLAVGALLGVAVYKLSQSFGGWKPMVEAVKKSLMDLWNVIGPIFMPALEALRKAFVEQLLPALVNLWNFIKPILLPVLAFLGKVVGVVLLAAFYAVVKALTWIAQNISMSINKFIEMSKVVGGIVGKIIQWFKDLPGKIKIGMENLPNIVKNIFNDLYNKIKGKLDEIKKKISDSLNPFVRHSPSLVDWVHRGAKEMEETYNGMFDRMGALTAQNRMGLTGAVKSISGIGEGGNQGGISKGNVINVSLSPNGIFARTPTEVREIGLQLAEAVKQSLGANMGKVKIIQ